MIPTGVPSYSVRRSWVLVAVTGVVVWRVAAFLSPSPLVSLHQTLRLPFALLGVLFLACGLWAWWVRPGRWTAVFLVYGIGGGIHWGGTIDPGHAGLELSLLFGYLALSAFAEAALLHLALIFPSGRSLKAGSPHALYSIGALAMLVTPFAGLLSTTVLELFASLILVVANLFSLAAGVLFLITLFRASAAVRHAAKLPLVVTSMWGTFVVATLGNEGLLLAQSDAWNLVSGLVPISLALALTSPALDTLRETAVS